MRPIPVTTIPPPPPNARCRIQVPDPSSPYRFSNPRLKTSSQNSSTSSSARANSKSKYRRKGHTRPSRAWLVGALFYFCATSGFGCWDAVEPEWSGAGGEIVRVLSGAGWIRRCGLRKERRAEATRPRSGDHPVWVWVWRRI